MPYKPKKPCSHPGCPELTREQYCPAHKKLAAQQYERHHRDKRTSKRYDGNWRKIRANHVSQFPLCAECLKRDVYTPVQEVHHIVPLSKGGTNDPENLMSLCKPCHASISAKEGERWG